MNILTNDKCLAWTISDNTSGSSKSKRGGAGKPKAAISSQDVFAMSISKYLGASAKAENDNAARQLALQEHQLALEERKMTLQEEQLKLEQRKMEQQHHGHGYGYGISYGGPRPGSEQDHHQYDRYHQHYNVVGQGHGIAYDRAGYDHQFNRDMGYEQQRYANSSRRLVTDLFTDSRVKDREAIEKYKRTVNELDEWRARGGDYYELCEVMSWTHSGQGSSSQFKSPKIDDSFGSSHQSDAINLTQDRGGYVISCLNDVFNIIFIYIFRIQSYLSWLKDR